MMHTEDRARACTLGIDSVELNTFRSRSMIDLVATWMGQCIVICNHMISIYIQVDHSRVLISLRLECACVRTIIENFM